MDKFLSTLSLRRATAADCIVLVHLYNFYPRSPCGERHVVSIVIDHMAEFLSTLSLRRATNSFITLFISRFYFYPRSPCGERR